ALHNQMLTAVQEISNLIEPVAGAARAEASQLGHKVRPPGPSRQAALALRSLGSLRLHSSGPTS
ncbi:hypothetical protein E2320_017964, partial [Naja naja]